MIVCLSRVYQSVRRTGRGGRALTEVKEQQSLLLNRRGGCFTIFVVAEWPYLSYSQYGHGVALFRHFSIL